MNDRNRPKDRSRRRTRVRTRGRANPVAVVVIALILVALLVTTVICMLRKSPLPPQGGIKVGTEFLLSSDSFKSIAAEVIPTNCLQTIFHQPRPKPQWQLVQRFCVK
jgi:hypothetical protein